MARHTGDGQDEDQAVIVPQQEVGPVESSAEDQSIGAETNSRAETEPPATNTARLEDIDPTADSSLVESEPAIYG